MPDASRDTLRSQLDEVLQEDPIEPEEIAILAGLLVRHDPSDDRLDAAIGKLHGAAVDWGSAADAASEAVLHADAVDDPDHAWAVLCTLDEVSAGTTFYGCPEAVAKPVGDAARAVRAFSALWAPLARGASKLLAMAPPLDIDPARRLWLAVEAAGIDVSDHDDRQPVTIPRHLRRLLGLDTVIVLADFAARAPTRAAAADQLPDDLVIETIGRLGDTEILLRVDGPDTLRLIATHPGAVFLRDGDTADMVDPEERDTVEVEAGPGDWEVRVGDASRSFTLE